MVVPDWAGVGRSGYVPYDKLTGELVISGLGKVISALDRPAIVMTHSMSGPYGWKLLEKCGERIAMVVAVAPGRPETSKRPPSSFRRRPTSWNFG